MVISRCQQHGCYNCVLFYLARTWHSESSRQHTLGHNEFFGFHVDLYALALLWTRLRRQRYRVDRDVDHDDSSRSFLFSHDPLFCCLSFQRLLRFYQLEKNAEKTKGNIKNRRLDGRRLLTVALSIKPWRDPDDFFEFF